MIYSNQEKEISLQIWFQKPKNSMSKEKYDPLQNNLTEEEPFCNFCILKNSVW